MENFQNRRVFCIRITKIIENGIFQHTRKNRRKLNAEAGKNVSAAKPVNRPPFITFLARKRDK